MSDLFYSDVSEFQANVDDSYPHRVLAFRACDGAYVDHNAAENLQWAIKARAAGRLDQFIVYVVYEPGTNGAVLATLDNLGVPHDCVTMIDVESWGGKIQGDHSADINNLAGSLASRQRSADLVLGYANEGDYAGIWPSRPSDVKLVVASYGPTRPSFPNMIAWQYYGATPDPVPAGYPTSTTPFGACDHNVLLAPLPGMSAGPKPDLKPVAPVVEDEDMILIYPAGSKSRVLLFGDNAIALQDGASVKALENAGVKVAGPLSLRDFNNIRGAGVNSPTGPVAKALATIAALLRGGK